ncbi:Rieske 2Fe-2S domain-containing protein [Rhizobiales bacterium TNE-4]|nr:Rieske 2Fe-2S domain-containing protein [Rhizobiales bacterium TNE-4]MBV1828598.1 Rieske 2Fe-2S domain-containing protein [Rhizobiales bacterium TNE-4]
MKSALKPNHYFDHDIFEAEKSAIFEHLWIFACLRTTINEDQAFCTRTIGHYTVIIQNFSGVIRAFHNSCPHRMMPLHNQEFGQGRLICPYHGWVFDENGLVKTIPKHDELYQFCDAERNELRLKEFHVSIIGEFVFVNLSSHPIPIESQFSAKLCDELSSISRHFGDVAVHVNIPVQYNWKLNFENVLDYNHIPYVHPKSFLPLIKKEDKSAEGNTKNEHTRFPNPDKNLIAQSWNSTTAMTVAHWPWHDFVDAYGPRDTYHNFFLFPNVNFISVGGLIFLVQQFVPIAPDRTEVRFTLCAARENVKLPALPAILRGHLKSEVEVLFEDVEQIEALQRSLSEKSSTVNHGAYEHRLVSFALAYLDLMDEK